MRTIELGRTAAQAEVVRLRRLIRRQVMRVVWGGVAAVFAIAVLVMLHVVAYTALVPQLLTPLLGTLAILAFDLVLALVFGVFAMGSSPDIVETEAKLIRDRALTGLRDSLAITAVFGTATRMLFRADSRKGRLGMTLTSLVANLMANKPR